MRRHKTALVALLAAATTFAGITLVRADIASDRAAAILVFPRVLVANLVAVEGSALSVEASDTVIQVSNTTNDPVSLHCFYVNANSKCTLSGDLCDPEHGINCTVPGDVCLPTWVETDFHVELTGQQPLVWRASKGLAGDMFPLNGIATRGPTGQNNAGSSIPPVTVDTIPIIPFSVFSQFQGELKCIVVDASGHGAARNAVKGEATIETHLSLTTPEGQQQTPWLEKYNAVGIQAVDGDANGDGVLELGGEANEYNGCPNVLVVDHFFDTFDVERATSLTGAASNGMGGGAGVAQIAFDSISELTLVPCNQDFRLQIPGRTVAQFLVFNEFEQRFSTSRTVDCFFRRFLSTIDTNDPSRSIFFSGVAGTTVGQTRIRGVSGGLLGVLSQTTEAAFEFLTFLGMDGAANLHFQGDREQPDRIVLP